eukprot:CAMPEP_0194705640 /NCGR_PEP_ID=MMETSP0295-20121207/29075_1 /TAXON_ID=39354 /ORGANISM="Heterosigma akashiwo, Strain CCMP2393" /LENGTH=65 /DNA_ID=CAMNT_0039601407 /DNA_START=26 /DNA_END=220 /DNA_ORIENTATION=+
MAENTCRELQERNACLEKQHQDMLHEVMAKATEQQAQMALDLARLRGEHLNQMGIAEAEDLEQEL